MAIPPKLFQQMSTLVANSLNAGHYGVRLAQDQQEVQAAQHLRYEVLFKESGGSANPEMLNSGARRRRMGRDCLPRCCGR